MLVAVRIIIISLLAGCMVQACAEDDAISYFPASGELNGQPWTGRSYMGLDRNCNRMVISISDVETGGTNDYPFSISLPIVEVGTYPIFNLVYRPPSNSLIECPRPDTVAARGHRLIGGDALGAPFVVVISDDVTDNQIRIESVSEGGQFIRGSFNLHLTMDTTDFRSGNSMGLDFNFRDVSFSARQVN